MNLAGSIKLIWLVTPKFSSLPTSTRAEEFGPLDKGASHASFTASIDRDDDPPGHLGHGFFGCPAARLGSRPAPRYRATRHSTRPLHAHRMHHCRRYFYRDRPIRMHLARLPPHSAAMTAPVPRHPTQRRSGAGDVFDSRCLH